MTNAVIIGCGYYLPEQIVTNFDLEKKIDTTDEWISSRTGIKQRHVASSTELTSDLATKAAKNALRNANIEANEIDLIIVATTTPDLTFPATATRVQSLLGINKGAAFDIQAVCSGFIYALSTANSFIKSGQFKNILVIGAEKMSAILDWNDRSTCVLFGDGAGAIILQAQENTNRGIITSCLRSDGNLNDLLKTTGGIGSTGDSGKITMQGQEIFKHAVDKMISSVEECMSEANIQKEDINLLIPHQANLRIINMIGKKFNLGEEKIITCIDKHANTSAASIPLALCYALETNRLKKNDLIALTALGGGLTWGSCILRW